MKKLVIIGLAIVAFFGILNGLVKVNCKDAVGYEPTFEKVTITAETDEGYFYQKTITDACGDEHHYTGIYYK